MGTIRMWTAGATWLLLFAWFSATTIAQTPFWVPTNVPYGGSIAALVSDANGNIFAGTGSGIYRSTDSGSTWTSSTRSVVPLRGALAVDTAGAILAGTNEGFWKSTDQGVSWEKTGLHNYPVKSLLVTPDGSLYAGLQHVTGQPSRGPGGVFHSVDGGLTWVSFGLQGQSISDLLLSPTHGLIATHPWGLFRRSEGDTGWVKLGTRGGHAICEDSLGNLYAGREVDGVHKSSDGGATWNPTGLQSPYTVVTLAGLSTGEIFAGVVPLDPSIPGGAFRTTDGGETWSSLGLQDWDIGCILALDSERLYMGSGRGVFRSTNGAATCEQANEGITATCIGPLLCLDTSTLLAGTGSGLFRSTDNGQSWIESGTGIFPHFINCLALDHKENVFAGNMVFSPNGGIYKSTDGGLSWRCTSKDSIKGMYTGINCLVVTQQNTLLAGVDGQGMIYRSADEGEHWTLVRKTGSNGVFDFSADSAGQVYGATWGDGVLRSTDDGVSWLYTNPGLPNLNVSCLASRAANEVFAGGFWGVARSTNAGDSWTNISAGLGGAWVVALAVDYRGDLLASTHAGGVFRTTDNGLTWGGDTLGLSGKRVHSFASSASAVFATDTVGVYRSMITPTAVSPQGPVLPAQVKLEQNYPNPFNPTTEIQFTIVDQRWAIVKLYDVLGQEVATLVNEVREPGVHTIRFDGSGLASGVYLYRLQAGDFVATRRLLLLR